MCICLPNDYFHVTMAELNGCKHKTQNIYLALYQNSFSTTVPEEHHRSLCPLLHDSIQKPGA